MNMITRLIIIVVVIAAAAAVLIFKNSRKTSAPIAPVQAKQDANSAAAPITVNKKIPRLVDLGANKCIPCKMMKPILESLKTEYAGRMEVVFIDVWENPAQAENMA